MKALKLTSILACCVCATVVGQNTPNSFWENVKYGGGFGLDFGNGFFGAGYRSGNVIFGMRYNVLHDDEKSIYFDPWMPFIRFFF